MDLTQQILVTQIRVLSKSRCSSNKTSDFLNILHDVLRGEIPEDFSPEDFLDMYKFAMHNKEKEDENKPIIFEEKIVVKKCMSPDWAFQGGCWPYKKNKVCKHMEE